METKYKTDPLIKEELANLLRWYNLKSDCNPAYITMPADDIVDAYLVEKDIALQGELRRIHGANTRNAKTELIFIACVSISAIIITSLSYNYFDWFSKINSFIGFISNSIK